MTMTPKSQALIEAYKKLSQKTSTRRISAKLSQGSVLDSALKALNLSTFKTDLKKVDDNAHDLILDMNDIMESDRQAQQGTSTKYQATKVKATRVQAIVKQITPLIDELDGMEFGDADKSMKLIPDAPFVHAVRELKIDSFVQQMKVTDAAVQLALREAQPGTEQYKDSLNIHGQLLRIMQQLVQLDKDLS